MTTETCLLLMLDIVNSETYFSSGLILLTLPVSFPYSESVRFIAN